MYPPVPAYAVPNDDQRASTNATTAAAAATDPPPSTIPDYTPLENGSASAPAEDADNLHPPAISCSRGDDSDLPLYQNVSERLPAYTSRPSPSSFGGHEPRTLPMILFKLGFCTFSSFFLLLLLLLLLLPHLTHSTLHRFSAHVDLGCFLPRRSVPEQVVPLPTSMVGGTTANGGGEGGVHGSCAGGGGYVGPALLDCVGDGFVLWVGGGCDGVCYHAGR
jgi:hypothetical protein